MRRPVLGDLFWTSGGILRDVLLILSGAILTWVGAEISLPWYPVPFTLQTLAATFCGLTLGSRRAAASQIAYLLAGLAGMPVFAHFSGGAPVLLGPTSGYLFAFVPAAWALGLASERGWTRQPVFLGLALALANLFILTVGAALLTIRFSVGDFWTGFTPFLVGAFFKSLVVVALLPLAERRARGNVADD